MYFEVANSGAPMCGIAGGFGAQQPAIERMVSAMAHRGPDDSGVFRSPSCVLGMTRLAIIDTSSAGHQPMVWGDDEVALVFNGEIYNHRALRRGLENRGHHFSSTSDTEVVLHLYLEFGEAFVSNLRGMFALAIYDRRSGALQEKLLLARDHLGIKPLIFSRISGGLVFASEMKALVASGLIEPRLDPRSVRQLLMRGSVCQPATILDGVEMLMPGHLLRGSPSGLQTECYWQPGTQRRPDVVRATYADQVRLVSAELERIVGEQMVADVPVGAFLSGGLDSSLMVALMTAIKPDPVRTFSVGFGLEGQDLDECADAQIVAESLGTLHSRLELGEDDVINGLGAFIEALDQPSVDGLNSWVVSGAAARHVKVAVSGTGGDELFCGYPWYRNMQDYAARRRVNWSDTAERLAARVSVFNQGLGSALDKVTPDGFVARFAAEYRHFDPYSAGQLLGVTADRLRAADCADMIRADRLPQACAADRTTALCLGSYTQNQLLRDIDTTSMAHSLEVRVPFLDPDLLDLALSLPPGARIGKGDPLATPGSYLALGAKRILMDVARSRLPPQVLTRPKRGFSLPIDRWLRVRLRPMLEDVVRNPTGQVAQIVDPQASGRVVDRFLEGTLHWGRPWLLLVLNLWVEDLRRLCGTHAQAAKPIDTGVLAIHA